MDPCPMNCPEDHFHSGSPFRFVRADPILGDIYEDPYTPPGMIFGIDTKYFNPRSEEGPA